MTNKQLIQKLKTDRYELLQDIELSNMDTDLTLQSIDMFTNDIDDNESGLDGNEEFDINEIDDYVDDVIQEISPITYSRVTAWLYYSNDHISLVNKAVEENMDNLEVFDIIYFISLALDEALRDDLLKIIYKITK